MTLESRVAILEKQVDQLRPKGSNHFDVEFLASNDHNELEELVRGFLRAKRPRQIIDSQLVADGAEYTYCAMFIYEPRSKPLP